MKTRAFTLIELLVVISIITLLSSVVLASLNSARAKAAIGAGRQFEANLYHAAADYAVGIWDFDECSGTAVADRSGNGNNGSFVATPTWTTSTATGAGCALGFDGSTQSILIPDSSSLDITGDMSIAFWAKPGTTQNANTDILSKHSTSNGGYVIEQTNTGTTNKFIFAWGDGTTFYCNPVASAPQLTANVWQHVAYVKSGATVSYYLNGAFLGSCTGGNATILANTDPVYISRWASSGGRQFNGQLDNVRIYAKSLSAFDVRALYAAGAEKHKMAVQ